MERFIGITFALALLGGYSIYSGATQLWQTTESSDTPETIALAKLIVRGEKGNRYVHITDFRMGKEFAEVGRKNQVVQDAYVPIWPKSAGDNPPAGRGVAIIKTSSMTAQFLNSETFEGMVIGKELNPLAQKTLAQRYAIDFKDVLVIEGKKPAPAREGWGWVGLGIALMLPLIVVLAHTLWADWRERKGSELIKMAWRPRSDAQQRTPEQNVAVLELTILIQNAVEAESKKEWQQALDGFEQAARSTDNLELAATIRDRVQKIRHQQHI